MDRRFSPSPVEKMIQQFRRNRRGNRWDGGRHLTKKVCVQLFKAISGEKADENHADYRRVALTTSLSLCKQAYA